MLFEKDDKFLHREAVVLLAFLVLLSMWAFQDKVLVKVRSRYFSFFCVFKLCVMD